MSQDKFNRPRNVTLEYAKSLQEFLPPLYNIYRVESIHLGINEVWFTVRSVYADYLRNVINMVIILTLEPYQKRVTTFRDRIPGYISSEFISENAGYKMIGRIVPVDSEENRISSDMKEYIPILPMYMSVDIDCLKIEIHYNFAYSSTKNFLSIDADLNSESRYRFALQDLHLYRSPKNTEKENLYTILYRDEKGEMLLFPNKVCDPDKSVYMPIYRYVDPIIQGILAETYEYSFYVGHIPNYHYCISNRPVYDKDTIKTMYDKICEEIRNKTDILDFLGKYNIPVIASVYRTATENDTYLLHYVYKDL